MLRIGRASNDLSVTAVLSYSTSGQNRMHIAGMKNPRDCAAAAAMVFASATVRAMRLRRAHAFPVLIAAVTTSGERLPRRREADVDQVYYANIAGRLVPIGCSANAIHRQAC